MTEASPFESKPLLQGELSAPRSLPTIEIDNVQGEFDPTEPPLAKMKMAFYVCPCGKGRGFVARPQPIPINCPAEVWEIYWACWAAF